jgi:purine/pyrimidine-nucleoside phosphorylase
MPMFSVGGNRKSTRIEKIMETQFDNVSVVVKANVYFDGKVVSHTVVMPDGSKRTLGLIYAGEYAFNTEAPERMEIVAGACRAKIAGETDWSDYEGGAFFEVPGNSSFEIAVDSGIAEYVCSFL